MNSSLYTQKTKLKHRQWDKRDYMQLMWDFSKIVCDLNFYHWWNVEDCNELKFLIDSETLRIDDRSSHRLRFSFEKLILVSVLYSLKSSDFHRSEFWQLFFLLITTFSLLNCERSQAEKQWCHATHDIRIRCV